MYNQWGYCCELGQVILNIAARIKLLFRVHFEIITSIGKFPPRGGRAQNGAELCVSDSRQPHCNRFANMELVHSKHAWHGKNPGSILGQGVLQ